MVELNGKGGNFFLILSSVEPLLLCLQNPNWKDELKRVERKHKIWQREMEGQIGT